MRSGMSPMRAPRPIRHTRSVATTSLLELLSMLTGDPTARAAFDTDSEGFLAQHGLADLDAVDLLDALSLGWSSVSPDIAGQLSPATSATTTSLTEALSQVLTPPDDSVDLDGPTAFDFDFGSGSFDVDSSPETASTIDDHADIGVDSPDGEAFDLDIDVVPEPVGVDSETHWDDTPWPEDPDAGADDGPDADLSIDDYLDGFL